MEQNSEESTADRAHGRLAARLRARLPDLRDAEARVAQVFLDRGADLVGLSVSDVAALASTAPSTVVRACQRLGFRGYQEVKIAAAREAPQPAVPSSGDPAERALATTVRAAREALDGLAATVGGAQLRAAAEAIATAGRVLVIGEGLSGAVALDAAYRLRALGCGVDVPADSSTAQLAAGTLPAGAACLAVSHSGATRTVVDAARRARAAGAEVIALTSYARSPLTEAATRSLVAGGQELVLGLEAVASRLAHLAVLDALMLLVRDRRGPSAEAALALSAEVTAQHTY
ncbi:MurR/RpiR family transcriptional regulator [Kitasatospora sp. NPDC052896]|uniref:MurR/RpiR family transcriptional regulator n=1 Tax=Kitasatospora sp. NPDC052896 TaxID=3364061 RepID=UPI0037CB994D